MKKIGILFDDSRMNAIDLSSPIHGNPGIGGTEFCFAMLIYYSVEYMKDYRIEVFHYNELVTFPQQVDKVVLRRNDWYEVNMSSPDILIFRAGCYEEKGLLEVMRCNNIRGIAWAHNYLTANVAGKLEKENAVTTVIFVSKYMYEHYKKHTIHNKARYIYNFVVDKGSITGRGQDYKPIVVYTGSLIAMKGFHLLAREWKFIVSKVPNAQLYVIGNGQLYFKDTIMGKYGIANEVYERRFMHYLLDDKSNIMESVHFCGKLGCEKQEIYKEAAVGIMNPSGRSETFGLSAVEMEFVGVPIVTYDKASYKDIIKNGETGFLCSSRRQFREKIIELLTNSQLNREMGNAAQHYVKGKFDTERIINTWIDVISEETPNRQSDVNMKNNHGLLVFVWDALKDFSFVLQEQVMKYIVKWLRY